MKIEKINENKIRVMINQDEAREWNISPKKISQNTPEVQEMFWAAIRLAERDVDFSIEDSKLFVETVPGNGGEFDMMITKINSEDELHDAIEQCGYKGRLRQNELRFKQRIPRQNILKRKHIYCFEDFDTACSAAGEIVEVYQGISTLYKMEDAYYLHLIPANLPSLWDADVRLTEFSAKLSNAQFWLGRLNEYGQKMIEGCAVEVMCQYFCAQR